MELFRLEHTKLWRKTSVKVSVVLCFTYMVIFGGILSFQWFNFGSMDGYTTAFGNHFDGYSMIKNKQEYALSFEGELTDETVQRLVKDYQRIKAAGMDEELQKTDYQTVNSWLMLLWPELYDKAD